MRHKFALFTVILFLFALFITMVVIIVVRYFHYKTQKGNINKGIHELSEQGYSKRSEEIKHKDSAYIKGVRSFERTPYNEEVGE